MDGVAETIYGIVRQILDQKESSTGIVPMSDAMGLYEVPDGLGLDSLDTAELSATLEDRFGHDPYTAGLFPQTLGELVSYYSARQT